MIERAAAKDGKDKIGKLADTTASTMIAESTKSRKGLVPDLRRQPKTLKAIGIGGLMKQKEKGKIEEAELEGAQGAGGGKSIKDSAGMGMPSISRSSQSDSTAPKLMSEDKRSLMSSTASPRRSTIAADKRSQAGTSLDKSMSGELVARFPGVSANFNALLQSSNTHLLFLARRIA